MKKKYIKPVIEMEAFHLDTGIASCSSNGKIGLGHAPEGCSYNAGSMVYFTPIHCGSGSVDPSAPVQGSDGFCYHGYNGSTMFINS